MSSDKKPFAADEVDNYGAADELDPEAKLTTREYTPDDKSSVQRVLDTPFAGVRWIQMLQKQFGGELLFAIFAAEHLIKGFDHSVNLEATSYLFRSYGVDAVNFPVYSAIKAMPWSLKPVFGAVSDAFPIFGYRRAPYIIISSLIGVACFLLIGSDRGQVFPVKLCVLMLVGCNLQGSMCDLLTEAQYSERITARPAHGPDLVSYVWLGQTIFALIASCVVGPMLTVGGPHLVFLICAFPASVVFWPMFRNYFGEKKKSKEDSVEVRRRMLEKWEVFIPVLAVLIGAIGLTVTGLMSSDKRLRLFVALGALVLVLLGIVVPLRPEIATVISFFILQSASSVNISGASFYFYTNTPEQYPEGPHFSKVFYSTVLGIVSAVCSLIGLYLYVTYFKYWGYRKLLYITNIILCLAYLADIVQFSRLNLRLGINDHIFVLGSHTIQRVVARIAWMPQVLMMSQMCPRGLEGTMYAILAGSSNFGGSIASFIGSYLLYASGVNPNGSPNESAQFHNLWIPSALAAILPALMILLIPWMIPDISQTDQMLMEDSSSPSVNSPLSRLRAHWSGR